ncbi:FIST C-terminal domain-containing protein [bacterium]|nr:FIST C-terminal domain-containing protein [bacterium]
MSTLMVTAASQAESTFEAVDQALISALKGLGPKPVSLAIVFASAGYDYQTILTEIRRRTGNAPLIGCSSAGEFTEKRDYKRSISLALISSDTHRFFTTTGHNLRANALECLQQATSQLPEQIDGFPHKTVLLVHDGLVGRGEEAVLAATIALGPTIRFAGGSAADDLQFKDSYVFIDDQVSQDSVGLCLVASQKPIAIGFQHGHVPFSDALTITKAEENVLFEIDGRNAWEVWTEVARAKAASWGIDVDTLQDDSAIGQFLIRYELGLSTGQQYKIRVPLSKNKDGSLNFACSIPTGATFKIVESTIDRQIASARAAAENALKSIGNTRLAGALIFDCVCRRIILADRFYEGVQQIKNVIGPIPLLGFETYGEICMVAGQLSGYHNTSTVVVLIPD